MSDTSGTTYKVHSTSTLKPSRSDGQPNIKHLSVKSVKMLFLLFYVVGHFGDDMYNEAPITRKKNIENSKGFNENKHIVECIPIEDISLIQDIVPQKINEYGGKENVCVKEASVHSHAAGDGPLGSKKKPTHDPFIDQNGIPIGSCAYQMTLAGWGKIDFNWSKDCPRFILYGCDSALTHLPRDSKPGETSFKNFALAISKLPHYKGVEVWGQPNKSVPSYFPDYRVTSLDRDIYDVHGYFTLPDWTEDPTYQIATVDPGGGWRATKAGYGLGGKPEKADPMHCYVNGKLIRTIDQGYFNDHRKQGTL
jgi:hypothetical protein